MICPECKKSFESPAELTDAFSSSDSLVHVVPPGTLIICPNCEQQFSSTSKKMRGSSWEKFSKEYSKLSERSAPEVKKQFLHEHDDFRAICEAARDETKASIQIVEKD